MRDIGSANAGCCDERVNRALLYLPELLVARLVSAALVCRVPAIAALGVPAFLAPMPVILCQRVSAPALRADSDFSHSQP